MSRRVVYVTRSPFVSGAERSLVRIAAALARERYRPFVIASHGGDLARALQAAAIEHCVTAMPLPERRWPFPSIASVIRLTARLRASGAALIHVNDTPAYVHAGLAARLLGLPRICHLRFEYEAAGLRWHLKWGVERVVFPSEHLARSARTRCPDLFPTGRSVVIADGFDAPATPDPVHLAQLAGAVGVVRGDPVVGFFGQVIEVKGVHDFLLMAARLLQRLPRTRFLLVGDDRQSGPSYRLRMEALARDIGIGAACRFTGFRDDVWELLHLCDVVVMPSHIEPFGLVAIEAAAAGRPLVASRVGGLVEIVEDGETGTLVPCGDVQALSEAVYGFLSNPVQAAAVGAQARAHVRAAFSAADQARKLADLYDDVLATTA